MTFSNEQNAALASPLSRDHVKTREQSGRKLSYIEGWVAIKEANRIFGFDGWNRETVELKCVAEAARKIGRAPNQRDGWGVTYIAKVRIAVGDVIREGCGTGHGIDADLGQAHESALKEGETDAMKRCLMTFGNPFGLALYDKEQSEVVDDKPKFAAEAYAPARIQAHSKPSSDITLDEYPDGQAKNWVDQQIKVIKDCKNIPELTGWLDKVAADKNGVAGDLAAPASGSILNRLKRKSPNLFDVVKTTYMAKLGDI